MCGTLNKPQGCHNNYCSRTPDPVWSNDHVASVILRYPDTTNQAEMKTKIEPQIRAQRPTNRFCVNVLERDMLEVYTLVQSIKNPSTPTN